jgi:hypothetical protein
MLEAVQLTSRIPFVPIYMLFRMKRVEMPGTPSRQAKVPPPVPPPLAPIPAGPKERELPI